MNVKFYNSQSDKRVLSKSLSSLASMDCDLKENCSIINPTIIVARKNLTQYASCNYMYIPSFRRYYFVTASALVGDMVEIRGHVDVLMTYASGIRGLYATVLRQENIYNDYLIDNQLPIRQTKEIQRALVGTYSAGTGIYLTVNGGDANG